MIRIYWVDLDLLDFLLLAVRGLLISNNDDPSLQTSYDTFISLFKNKPV